VVVANILAGPLRELAPLIAGHGKAGSLMALSGVLESQRQSWRPSTASGSKWTRLR
jgi:ribosomal protein L11 methylase PrmA